MYEKAHKEKVLGRMDVERRIALYTILRYTKKDLDPSRRIDKILEGIDKRIRKYTSSDPLEYQAGLEELIIFSEEYLDDKEKRAIWDTMRGSYKSKLLAKHTYLRKSLIKNRSWLIGYLSG